KSLSWKLVGVDGSGDLIKVGKYLYAAGGGKLTAVKIYGSWFAGKVVWTIDIPEDVVRLIAADNQLFAVTLDGQILAFAGPETASPQQWKQELAPLKQEDADQLPATLANFVDSDLGYALWFGLDDEAALRSFILKTKLQIVVVDENIEAVDRFRRTVDATGEYGRRISAHVGSISTFQAPPYVCRLVVLSPHVASQAAQNPEQLAEAYRSVRPYGGSLVAITASGDEASVIGRQIQAAELEKAKVAASGQLCVVTREGALPGAANWTHQYGDIANTVKSDDSRVKLPLGVLWFGGSSNLDVLPRHGHGPPEQIVDGRLFIEGMTSLSCRDVYTGQILWQRTFENLGTYDIYFDDTYADTPLDPAYNQVHIPGANGRGTNFVATHDLVYIVEGDACNVLDAKTGETVKVISLPADVPKENRQWAYIGVYNDILLAGAGFANYRERHSISFDEVDKLLSGNSKGFGSKSMDVSASMGLIAFDRHTGEQIWKTDAKHSFLHNGIVAGDGRIYCLDKLPGPVEDKLRRRGISAPDTYRILALNADSGEPIWEVDENIFGTWLGYSEEYSLLLQAGAAASDRMKTEVGQGMAVYEGASGQERWRVDNREYSGPCILHGDTILTNANSYQLSSGAFSLLDGRPKLIMNPLTGVEQPWQISRAYGCNNIIASENMLTFRSGAAGYYDLETMSGTGNLGGFKSGCTSNLVVANGLLNAPDYTRTCSCSYQNQTSLALVHMPQMDMWSVNNTATLTKPGQRIRRLGINFGAPGDRTDNTGTLWLDYPPIGGESAQVEIDFSNEPTYQHQHTLKFSGDALPWVAASSAQGLDELVIPLKFKTPTSENGLVFTVKSANDDVEEQP
ncbi:MAG: PQQ-binding-like beta-propeller repeat protein, partial [Planctomycetales bacterium]|nr:PQQ-binding-like beta-propeller repeat protein [Planctomycetales bacterium]